MNKGTLIRKLQERFGAIYEDEEISMENLAFLNERDEIKEIYSWDFEAFVKNYKLIKEYALEEELLKNLAWKIENLLSTDEILRIKKSDFFNEFGKHTIIKEALLEREINEKV